MYFKQLVKKIIGLFGFDLVRYRLEDHYSLDVPSVFVEIYKKVRPYTMTSPERIFSLCEAVKYIQNNNIEGDIVALMIGSDVSIGAFSEIVIMKSSPYSPVQSKLVIGNKVII